MRDMIEKHFDKLLLTALALILMMLGAFAVAFKNDKALDWAIQSEATVLGAVVALATGRAIANGGRDHEKTPTPPEIGRAHV